jgi:5-methylcytosine-specific restriction endonuclease McrBC regulatory subunit McrC
MQASAALRCLSNVPSSQNPIRDAEEALRTSSDPTLHRVLTLCILLFRNQGQALNHGAEELRAGFVLDMAWLFERYVRALLSTALGALAFPYKRTLVYNVDGVDSSIELDGLVQLPDQRIVIECKYRRVVDSAGAIMRDRWSSEHVYQAVAYASHRDVDAQAAVLIFPHVGLAEPLIEHAHIGSFAKSTTGVRLRVWSISLDKPANQVVTALALRARTLLK